MHERKPRFTSLSGLDINHVYSRDDLKDWSPENDLGHPGEFPYTLGVYPTMYRGQFWPLRHYAGFGSADDTNRCFEYLLRHGQTGLSVAFDMPTLMGIDTDDARAHGEVGHCGVAISSLVGMERLFEDIPLEQVTTSMTINGPATVRTLFRPGTPMKENCLFRNRATRMRPVYMISGGVTKFSKAHQDKGFRLIGATKIGQS